MDAARIADLADRLTQTAAAARLPESMMTVDAMRPRPFRIDRWHRDLSDTFTVELEPLEGPPLAFQPGQFNMLYIYGAGEVPISISGDPDRLDRLIHTTRAVGQVTNAMKALKVGDVIGVRGPFGTPWPVEAADGHDVVIVAGGIGLAPLRPLIHAILARRARVGTVVLLYGARTPEDILYRKQVAAWRGRFDMTVHVTVDRATGRWSGPVGMVTRLIARGGFDARETVAYICGPEVMMRYAASALIERGVSPANTFLSMERNMKCAIGFCGHCQWGSDFVCKDGPVFQYDRVAARLSQSEV